jgi:hypothetical protein
MIDPALRPDPDGDFVVLDASWFAGMRDWHALAEMVSQSRAAITAGGLLLDVRRAAFTPAAREAHLLVAAVVGYPAVAIVVQGDASYGCARMVSTLIEIRGSKASAFLTAQEAAAWLSRQGRGEPEGAVDEARLGLA